MPTGEVCDLTEPHDTYVITQMMTCAAPTLEGLTAVVNEALASITQDHAGLKQPLLIFAEPTRYVAVLIYGRGPTTIRSIRFSGRTE